MRWLWWVPKGTKLDFTDDATLAIRLADHERPIACPSCASVAPAFSLALLRSWVLRDGVLVGVVTGERVACQAKGCGHQYSIGPQGTFAHNPTAQPITQMAPTQQPRGPSQPEEAEASMPIPRQPPRGI